MHLLIGRPIEVLHSKNKSQFSNYHSLWLQNDCSDSVISSSMINLVRNHIILRTIVSQTDNVVLLFIH
jgi:hypothetical protein